MTEEAEPDPDPVIICTGCGRQYKWTPAVAGKSAKCRCGEQVTMPRLKPGEIGDEDALPRVDLIDEESGKPSRSRAMTQDPSAFFDEVGGEILKSRRPKRGASPDTPSPASPLTPFPPTQPAPAAGTPIQSAPPSLSSPKSTSSLPPFQFSASPASASDPPASSPPAPVVTPPWANAPAAPSTPSASRAPAAPDPQPSFVPIPDRVAGDARRCPGCGKEYALDTVVCTACGINLVTGHKFQAEVGEVEEQDFELVEDEPMSHRALQFFADRVPGVFNPMVLAMSILLGLVGLGILGFGMVVVLVMKAVFSAVAICGAGMVAWGQAMAWLVFGELTVAINAMVEFDEKKWTTFGILFFLPMPIFFIIFKFVAT